MESKAPRVGHKKSRKGCAQCKRRHVKCDEEAPCSNCSRHGVPCSLAGGPWVPRDDARERRTSTTPSSPTISRTTSQEGASASRTDTASASPSQGDEREEHCAFTALTGLIERPMLDRNSTEWLLDLQLLHHYEAHTRMILAARPGADQILRIWSEDVPRIACKSDYVMHGLLGFASLHKAAQEPELASRLRASAVEHLDKALVLYRQDRSAAGSENADARLLFTWLVALFSFAVPPSLPPIDAVIELFLLVKGVDAVLGDTWFWVSQGPFAPMLTGSLTLSPDEFKLPHGMDLGIGHLDFMLGIEAMLPDDRRICVLILGELQALYAEIQQTRGTCNVASVICFPRQDSAPYSNLLKRRVPQALVILAYYCVLLDLLDTRWWIHGWSRRVLHDVVGCLNEVWRSWIDWPVSAVLLKDFALPNMSADLMV